MDSASYLGSSRVGVEKSVGFLALLYITDKGWVSRTTFWVSAHSPTVVFFPPCHCRLLLCCLGRTPFMFRTLLVLLHPYLKVQQGNLHMPYQRSSPWINDYGYRTSFPSATVTIIKRLRREMHQGCSPECVLTVAFKSSSPGRGSAAQNQFVLKWLSVYLFVRLSLSFKLWEVWSSSLYKEKL